LEAEFEVTRRANGVVEGALRPKMRFEVVDTIMNDGLPIELVCPIVVCSPEAMAFTGLPQTHWKVPATQRCPIG